MTTTAKTGSYKYYPGFDLATYISTFGNVDVSLRWIETSTVYTANLSLSTGSFFIPVSGTFNGVTYSSFESAVDSKLQQLTGANRLRFRWNNLSSQYEFVTTTISAFTATFGTTAGLNLYGFPVGVNRLASGTVLTGGLSPWFLWTASETAMGVPYTGPYEPNAIYKDRYSDNGQFKISIGSRGSVQFEDWNCPWEPRSNIYNFETGSISIYTFQQFITDIRSTVPFILVSGTQTQLSGNYKTSAKGVYMMRDEASLFKPSFTEGTWDQYLTVPISTHIMFR